MRPETGNRELETYCLVPENPASKTPSFNKYCFGKAFQQKIMMTTGIAKGRCQLRTAGRLLIIR